MNEEQETKLKEFFVNFNNTMNDIQNYLKTKETVSTAVMNSFLNGMQLCVDNLKKDIM